MWIRNGVWSTAMAVVAFAAPAMAQVQDVTPYYGLVTTDKAVMRSGENDRFYKVGEIDAGTVVLVDGEGQAWSRVSYPANIGAFVRVEDVDVTGATAKLKAGSKLKAANLAQGYVGSWKSLLTTALPAGTTLKIIEPAKEGDGPVVGYKVAAPDSARGFVESRNIRRANETEIAAYKSKGGVLPTLPETKTAEATPKPTTTPAPTPAPVTTPLANKPEQPKTGEPTTPVTKPVTIADPMAKPSTTPGTEPTTTPAAAQDTPRRIATAEELEVTFNEVWKQPLLTAELDELIAEYQRAIANTTEDAMNYRGLTQRLSALQLRQDSRNKRRELEDARAKLEAGNSRLETQLKELEKSRVYTIVGQLEPSTVYDGKRLPQMYRVVSVGGAGQRTLGYLKKSEEIDLDALLGRVVGVIGEATLDRSLMLNIITPVRVDPLKTEGTETPVDAAPATTDATPTGTSEGK